MASNVKTLISNLLINKSMSSVAVCETGKSFFNVHINVELWSAFQTNGPPIYHEVQTPATGNQSGINSTSTKPEKVTDQFPVVQTEMTQHIPFPSNALQTCSTVKFTESETKCHANHIKLLLQYNVSTSNEINYRWHPVTMSIFSTRKIHFFATPLFVRKAPWGHDQGVSIYEHTALC